MIPGFTLTVVPMKAARKPAIVFLGGGRITGALLAGLRMTNYDQPIVVHDRRPQKLRQLKVRYGVKVEPESPPRGRAGPSSDRRRAAGLSPRIVAADWTRRADDCRQPGCGHSAQKPARMDGPPVRWARAMPSPVARSGRGLTALTFDRDFPAATRREISATSSRASDESSKSPRASSTPLP